MGDRMGDYTISELMDWNEQIETLITQNHLNCYSQEFEIISFEDMLCYEAYVGMPSHYPHWSFGKTYEKMKTLYQYNLSGLPYEMVINSDPCIAYLMKDNTLLLQILTIAHVYGHNDFFKNNRLFQKGTKAKRTLEMFKNHANRVRGYIQDPSIGYKKVERILDGAHALKMQCSTVVGIKYESKEEKKKRILEEYRKDKQPRIQFPLLEKTTPEEFPALHKIPLEPEQDILHFLVEYGDLEEWEKDILLIVSEENSYFIPQIETKIMNEGWASYWHYTILNQLQLSQGLHMEFLKRHNMVIRPHMGQVNPYYVGFKIFEDLEKRYGREKMFEVRALERDESFLRKYLTFELCQEMNLFEYDQQEQYYIVTEVANEEGWKKIRDSLARSVGMGTVPIMHVTDVGKMDRTLYLEHEHDGRDLEYSYASETLKYLQELWGGKVVLQTYMNQISKELICNEEKRVTLKNKNE